MKATPPSVPPSRYERVLVVACVSALVGLAFMAWSLFDPRPPPVLIALSVGQAIGTLSFLLYLGVVLRSIRKP
jgi:hypothetical protein